MGLLHAAPWQPETIEIHELVEGYRAAKTLQHLSIPAQLSSAIANYILRCGSELGRRGINAEKLTRDANDE